MLIPNQTQIPFITIQTMDQSLSMSIKLIRTDSWKHEYKRSELPTDITIFCNVNEVGEKTIV